MRRDRQPAGENTLDGSSVLCRGLFNKGNKKYIAHTRGYHQKQIEYRQKVVEGKVAASVDKINTFPTSGKSTMTFDIKNAGKPIALIYTDT